MKDKKHDVQVHIYLTAEQREKLIEIMLETSYEVSLSAFLRKIIFKALNIK